MIAYNSCANLLTHKRLEYDDGKTGYDWNEFFPKRNELYHKFQGYTCRRAVFDNKCLSGSELLKYCPSNNKHCDDEGKCGEESKEKFPELSYAKYFTNCKIDAEDIAWKAMDPSATDLFQDIDEASKLILVKVAMLENAEGVYHT